MKLEVACVKQTVLLLSTGSLCGLLILFGGPWITTPKRADNYEAKRMKTAIIGFRPDPDVKDMLDRACAATGLTATRLLNDSARDAVPGLLRRYAQSATHAAQAMTVARAKHAAVSQEDAETIPDLLAPPEAAKAGQKVSAAIVSAELQRRKRRAGQP